MVRCGRCSRARDRDGLPDVARGRGRRRRASTAWRGRPASIASGATSDSPSAPCSSALWRTGSTRASRSLSSRCSPRLSGLVVAVRMRETTAGRPALRPRTIAFDERAKPRRTSRRPSSDVHAGDRRRPLPVPSSQLDDRGTPPSPSPGPKEPRAWKPSASIAPTPPTPSTSKPSRPGCTARSSCPAAPITTRHARSSAAINDRHPALIVRAADAADVAQDRVPGARIGPGAVGPRWRPQPGRPRDERRRHRPRPRHDEGPPHRSRAASRVGTARPDRGGVHGRRGGPRSGDAVRRHRFGRHRRADARRRDRLAGRASTG